MTKESKKEELIREDTRNIDDEKIIYDFFEDEQSMLSGNIPKPPPMELYDAYMRNKMNNN